MDMDIHDSIIAMVSGFRKTAEAYGIDSSRELSVILNGGAVMLKKSDFDTAGFLKDLGLSIGGAAIGMKGFRAGVSAHASRSFNRRMRIARRMTYKDLARVGAIPQKHFVLTSGKDIAAATGQLTGNPVKDIITRIRLRMRFRDSLRGDNAAYLSRDSRTGAPIYIGNRHGMPVDIARHETGHYLSDLSRPYIGDYQNEVLSARADSGKYEHVSPWKFNEQLKTMPGLELEAWKRAPGKIDDKQLRRAALRTYLVKQHLDDKLPDSAINDLMMGGSLAYGLGTGLDNK